MTFSELESINTCDGEGVLELWPNSVYVLSLAERLPQKYAQMKSQLDHLEINHSLFPAVDGYNLEITDLRDDSYFYGIDLKNKTKAIERSVVYKINCNAEKESLEDFVYYTTSDHNVRLLSSGELGCSCSHRKMWLDVIDKDYSNALVLEDDVRFKPYFAEGVKKILGQLLYHDWDICFLYLTGVRPVSTKDEDIGKIIKINDKGTIFGTVSYLVSNSGAYKLVNISRSTNYAIDDTIGNKVELLNAYKSYIYLVKVDVMGSEIRKMGRAF
jgi:glycosyl transferase family 25